MKTLTDQELKFKLFHETSGIMKRSALAELLRRERSKTRERVWRIAFAVYCEATGLPPTDETKEQFAQEGVAMLGLEEHPGTGKSPFTGQVQTYYEVDKHGGIQELPAQQANPLKATN